MLLKTHVNLSGFRLVLIIMAAVSLLVMLMLTQIDNIIHGVLYDFGLRFSYQWAMPYWINSGLIIGLSWFNIAASFILIYYVYKRRNSQKILQAAGDHLIKEDQFQQKLGFYDNSKETLISEQISDLSLQIKQYNVKRPEEVVDSQC